jgi:Zn-finger nucleic acid-binding protein
MDPYRGDARIGACPRCQNELVSDGELRLACLRGCGEWYPREQADHRVHWEHVVLAARFLDSGWPWGAAACPSCHASMTVAYREELRFDRCERHGVWLDAGESVRFFQLFART